MPRISDTRDTLNLHIIRSRVLATATAAAAASLERTRFCRWRRVGEKELMKEATAEFQVI